MWVKARTPFGTPARTPAPQTVANRRMIDGQTHAAYHATGTTAPTDRLESGNALLHRRFSTSVDGGGGAEMLFAKDAIGPAAVFVLRPAAV